MGILEHKTMHNLLKLNHKQQLQELMDGRKSRPQKNVQTQHKQILHDFTSNEFKVLDQRNFEQEIKFMDRKKAGVGRYQNDHKKKQIKCLQAKSKALMEIKPPFMQTTRDFSRDDSNNEFEDFDILQIARPSLTASQKRNEFDQTFQEPKVKYQNTARKLQKIKKQYPHLSTPQSTILAQSQNNLCIVKQTISMKKPQTSNLANRQRYVRAGSQTYTNAGQQTKNSELNLSLNSGHFNSPVSDSQINIQQSGISQWQTKNLNLGSSSSIVQDSEKQQQFSAITPRKTQGQKQLITFICKNPLICLSPVNISEMSKNQIIMKKPQKRAISSYFRPITTKIKNPNFTKKDKRFLVKGQNQDSFCKQILGSKMVISQKSLKRQIKSPKVKVNYDGNIFSAEHAVSKLIHQTTRNTQDNSIILGNEDISHVTSINRESKQSNREIVFSVDQNNKDKSYIYPNQKVEGDDTFLSSFQDFRPFVRNNFLYQR